MKKITHILFLVVSFLTITNINAQPSIYQPGDYKDGIYEKATVTISTYKKGRFENATDEEIINVVGVHESFHCTDKKQVSADREKGMCSGTWESEKLTLNAEYEGWIEYINNGIDLKDTKSKDEAIKKTEKIREIYEEPHPDSKDCDGTGVGRPSMYGIDSKGDIRTESRYKKQEIKENNQNPEPSKNP